MKCCLFQSFSLGGRICSTGFTVLTNFDFTTCLYTVRSHEVAVSCIHFYWFSVAFVPGRQNFTSDAIEHFLWLFWNVQRFLLLLLRLNNPLIEVLGSYAGVFRGARLSSLTTNACSTENNIPFPNLANHIVLSKLWKLDLDLWVSNNYSVCRKHWQSFMTSTKC